jgi:hypothetical protein
MKVRINPDHPEAGIYKELNPANEYKVIGIEADDYRIVSDEGLPYLYPHELFVVLDESIPSDWQTKYGQDGERYSYPLELNAPGFFEDYFDGDRAAVIKLRQYLSRYRK